MPRIFYVSLALALWIIALAQLGNFVLHLVLAAL